ASATLAPAETAPPGVLQGTPGAFGRKRTIRALRARNEARIFSASSGGPLIASTAAHWLTCEAQESVFVTQRTNCGARTGFEAKPIRQPVIAQVLEAPSEMIVRSTIPGSDAIDANDPS